MAKRKAIGDIPTKVGIVTVWLDVMGVHFDAARAAMLASGVVTAKNGPRPRSMFPTAATPPGICLVERMSFTAIPLLPELCTSLGAEFTRAIDGRPVESDRLSTLDARLLTVAAFPAWMFVTKPIGSAPLAPTRIGTKLRRPYAIGPHFKLTLALYALNGVQDRSFQTIKILR